MKTTFFNPEPKPAPPRLALNQREAAQALGVSAPTLIGLTRAGRVPCVRLGTRTLYPVDGLRRWLDTEAAKQGTTVGTDPGATAVAQAVP